ncbi:cupin domain-containing protein [Porticoccaceae bacterium]|nr:cupin domain-containing protein [Porticoccaceae bacterium]
MKKFTCRLAILFLILTSGIINADPLLVSQSFDWRSINIDQQNRTEIKKIVKASSDGFKTLEISLVNIAPGDSFSLDSTDSNVESLIIIKSGTTTQNYRENLKEMSAGSVSLIMPKDTVTISNNEKITSTFYLLKWVTRQTDTIEPPPSQTEIESVFVNWDDIEFIENKKGGRRNIIRQPTAMLKEFEMHVTTLNEGMRSHLPHTHLDEEIILVRFGEVEEFIDGELHEVGAGSLIFLRSMIPHGIRNIGRGDAEYYAFKWAPK